MNMLTTYVGQWGLSSDGTFKENPWYVLSGNRVVEHGFGSLPDSSHIVKLPEGVVIPGLVNAHTHLELSFLKGKLSLSLGSMSDFVKSIAAERKNVTPQEIRQEAFAAMRYAYERGTYYYNDIANDAEFSRFLSSSIYFHGNRFYEALGFSPEVSEKRIAEVEKVIRADKHIQPTPHSPYGSSPQIIKNMREWDRNNSLSIHLLESPHEHLITKGKGELMDFLESINQHHRHPEYKNLSIVEYLNEMGVYQYKNLFLVHLTYATEHDIEYLSEHVPHAAWVLCHRSNRFMGFERTNFEKLFKSPLKMLIGTDSMASAPNVSVLDELYALALEDFTNESNLWQAATHSAYSYLDIHSYQLPYFFFAGAKPSIDSLYETGKSVLLGQHLMALEEEPALDL